nr:LysR substrate-binding domain-containing protein [Roseomonas acroporae]
MFRLVAEAGSITAGAERAGLALASASARLRGMEAALGVALLARHRRGVATTTAGEALLRHARLVLDQMERLRGDMGAFAKGLRGEVRLLANTAATTEFLPGPLAAFLAAEPQVDVVLAERPSRVVAEALCAGQADLGVVADHVDRTGLESRPFRVDRLVLVVPGGHALARRHGPVPFAMVTGESCIGLSEGSALQAHLEAQAARLGVRLRYRVRVPSFEAVCRLVAGGAGLGVVSETAARRWPRGPALRHAALADPWATRQLRLCARRFDELPAHAQALAAALAGSA